MAPSLFEAAAGAVRTQGGRSAISAIWNSGARPALGARVRVQFSELSADRCAIARFGSWDIAVPNAVPGDVADIEVRDRRGAEYRGHLLTLVRPSPLRVRPPCPIFDRCGGCQWQRVDTTAQAEYKGALVQRALAASGHGHLPVKSVAATIPWGYRTAGTYVPAIGAELPALGLHPSGGNSPVCIRRCLIQSPALQDVFEATQRAWRTLEPRLREDSPTACRQVRIRVGDASGEAAVGLVLETTPTPRQRDAIVDAIRTHLTRIVEIAAIAVPRPRRAAGPMSKLRWGRPGVVDTILGYWYQAPVFAPFPVTGRAAPEAITSALGALALDDETTLLETEAGIGAYTLPAAAAARRVLGRTAPEFLGPARQNAAWNETANVLFVDRSMCTLAATLRSHAPIQRALVRLTPEAVPFEMFYEAGVQRLVLLTTSPRRLAEVLAAAEREGFEPRSVTVIDSYPQTSRADIHATLEARSRRGGPPAMWAYEPSSSAQHRPVNR